MTALETVATVFRALTFVVLYFIIGFGPGFIIGVLIANRMLGDRSKPTRLAEHELAIKRAVEHNAQWHPGHDRWKKE